jgi:hypothetical protein
MGIRTPDLLHAMQALYQLSYSPWIRGRTAPSSVASATPVYKNLAPVRCAADLRRPRDSRPPAWRPAHRARASVDRYLSVLSS